VSGTSRDNRKAPATGAFFIACCLLLLAISGFARAQTAQACQVDHIDQQVEIDQVFDGDTVLLRDGRKVRLLGINTPELSHDDRPAEPLAIEARHALQSLIKQADSIGLRYESRRQDRYHRTLAHVIIDGRINVQQVLLRQGLAQAIVVPPDLWQWECYQHAEDDARGKAVGVWSLDYYQAADVEKQSPARGGFQFIRGRIMHVGRGSNTVWLDLSADVSLRIDRADWQYFPQQDWDVMQGREVVARGWLYRNRDRWQMRIRHPQNINIGLRTKD